MGMFDWFASHNDSNRDGLAPWDGRPSIYTHLLSNIRPGTRGLLEAGQVLPDEKPVSEDEIRWAPGALDGVMTHHMQHGQAAPEATDAHNLLRTFTITPTLTNKVAVYAYAVDHDPVSYIDDLIELVVNERAINQQRLYEISRAFILEGADRGPVKLGIALLGLFREKSSLEFFRVLGRHDEFTLFCAVALANGADDAEVELWELAKQVDGWGRVHLVERLADTQNTQIRDWLIREGFKTSGLDMYLAYTCAVTGGLAEALAPDTIDDELATSAASLISALIEGGPTSDIRDYSEGPSAFLRFVGHIERRDATPAQLVTVARIRDFVSNAEENWGALAEHGWDDSVRERIRNAATGVLESPVQINRIADGLLSDNEGTFFAAYEAAGHLNVDRWAAVWRRLQKDPLDSSRWYHAMQQANEGNIETLVEFARQHLNLSAIATGPARALGFGESYTHHSCLDFVLQELHRFPGRGEDLLIAGLASPVTRNRNMAINALQAWGSEQQTRALTQALQQLERVEPEQATRERLRDMLGHDRPSDDGD